jgi:type IVB pilus formation R64 PilN family outer membrane protein
LGRNGTANAVFDSQSKTSFETKAQNQLTGLILSVDAMLTQSGKATLSQENQTLIVTDTKPALDRVAAFVAEQNKIMSRRVRVMLEAIEVVDRDGSDVGVEWDILYGAVRRSVNLLSPGSTTSTQAGSMGITQNTGRYAGSSLVVKALSEVGVVVNRRFFPFLTTSGRPVTQAIRSTFNYVDQVQATSVASSINTVSQAPTVTQKDETVGTFVTIVPTAKSDGTIFISLSFDQTSAQPLVPFTVGSSGAQVTVQQKTIDGSGIIQEVPVRSGQTVIVGGIESTTSQDSVRRLFAGAPLLSGGGDTSKVTKSRMVLLVTAVAEEDI